MKHDGMDSEYTESSSSTFSPVTSEPPVAIMSSVQHTPEYPEHPELPTPQPFETESSIMTDDFSDYGSLDGHSDVFSMVSDINVYIETNGRRYHCYFGPDRNPLPSDTFEISRLDLLHESTYVISGCTIYHAPLDLPSVHRVLDLGTGTGIWAIEFADDNPQAEVLGIDLAPIQPTWIPANCNFQIDDFEQDWTFSMPFDFIHARTIAQCVNNWPRLLERAKNHLNPGGWLELGEYLLALECDYGTLPADWPPVVLFEMIRHAAGRIGRMFPDDRSMRRMLEEAGFVDIRVKRLMLPGGPWPKSERLKEAGVMCNQLAETGYEAYGLHLLRFVLGMDVETAMGYIERARETHKTVEMLKLHAYMPYYSVCGRKPYEDE